MPRYLEDLPVGTTDSYGGMVVDRDEVIAFARAYDPQPFHLDDAAAAANPVFGRLSASGWHTAAMTMRMSAARWAEQGIQGRGAAGLDELSWLRPVYPGDTLRVETEVIGARPSVSRPELGLLKIRSIVFNQHDQPVMREITNVMIQRRPPA
ncbi:MaoC family dehydratase [Sphingomonas bacterium]|uniref:MaoC family dehydratase n=1 Tax=Sphingomonas bacterium TaxID=1895847 RepID=UPI001576752C|nr:MaoC family dehydratase [Sphingomonas bacterium]